MATAETAHSSYTRPSTRKLVRCHALQHGDRLVTIDYCDVTSTYL